LNDQKLGGAAERGDDLALGGVEVTPGDHGADLTVRRGLLGA
jgi:hypothetical protein